MDSLESTQPLETESLDNQGQSDLTDWTESLDNQGQSDSVDVPNENEDNGETVLTEDDYQKLFKAGIITSPDEKGLKSYKSLQTEFGRRNEERKMLEQGFEPYGGIDQVKKIAEFIGSRKDVLENFNKFLQRENLRLLTGKSDLNFSEESDYNGTEDTAEVESAVKLIQQVADKVAQQKIEEAIANNITPIKQRYQEERINQIFKEMDNLPDIGSIWREYQSVMAEIAPSVLRSDEMENPSLKSLKRLFFAAVDEKGDLEKLYQKGYETKLKAVKKQSVEKPSPVGKNTSLKAKTILEAAEQAAREMNLTI